MTAMKWSRFMAPIALAMLLLAARDTQDSMKPGLIGQYWNVSKEMKKFPEDLVTAEKPNPVRIDGVINFDAKEGRGFFKEGREEGLPWKEYFAVVWTGSVRIPKDGEYTFYLNSHDGSKLHLD
ncbi:MAG TPA: PA14 domain-containing protein, partial [Planctomycetota bacterium]|nr:PA14 domain-containing protein [Planctomycetota bacterium]